jgi:hypothetical protein
MGPKKVVAEKAERKAKVAKADKVDKPKRAPSAYLIFCSERRVAVKEANPDATFKDMGKLLGAEWATLDDKARQVHILLV